MTKIIIALASLFAVLVLDSLAGQSALLSVFDFAAIYLILVWFNLSTRSQEGAWGICLVISIVMGIFRQQNLGVLILALSLALLVTNIVIQISRRHLDYHLAMVLTFFSFCLLVSILFGAIPELGHAIIYVVVNCGIAYVIQAVIMRNSENHATRNGYKLK